jgi:hypothetical protein
MFTELIEHIQSVTIYEEDERHAGDPLKPERNSREMHEVFLKNPLTIAVFVETVLNLNGVSFNQTMHRKVKRLFFEGKSYIVLPCMYLQSMRFYAGMELTERKSFLFYYNEKNSYRNQSDLANRVSGFSMLFNRRSWAQPEVEEIEQNVDLMTIE